MYKGEPVSPFRGGDPWEPRVDRVASWPAGNAICFWREPWVLADPDNRQRDQDCEGSEEMVYSELPKSRARE